jgi:hypothetical protein
VIYKRIDSAKMMRFCGKSTLDTEKTGCAKFSSDVFHKISKKLPQKRITWPSPISRQTKILLNNNTKVKLAKFNSIRVVIITL